MEGWAEGGKDRQKDEWKGRRKDRQTLFYRTLQVIAGGPKNGTP